MQAIITVEEPFVSGCETHRRSQWSVVQIAASHWLPVGSSHTSEAHVARLKGDAMGFAMQVRPVSYMRESFRRLLWDLVAFGVPSA